jgi:hypothetical protein
LKEFDLLRPVVQQAESLQSFPFLHRAIWFGEYPVVAPMKSQRRVVSRGSGKDNDDKSQIYDNS